MDVSTVVWASPIEVDELDMVCLVEDDIWSSQVTKNISIFMQFPQYFLDLWTDGLR